MLTRVDVVIDDGEDDSREIALSLPIFGVTPKDPIIIQKVTGLDPPDINLFIGDYARDGGVYQGRRVGNRNPVFTLDLNPNPALGQTVQGLRELLYKAFIDPLVEFDHVKFLLYDERGVGYEKYVVGYTEKFETEIFSTDTMAMISVICPDPYIRDNRETIHQSDSGRWLNLPFFYSGTAETGFEVVIYADVATNILTLDLNGRKMIINHDFSVGDKITLNTTPGFRSIWLHPTSGPDSSLIAALSPSSDWLFLHSPRNMIQVYAEDDTQQYFSIESLKYRQTYWGI